MSFESLFKNIDPVISSILDASLGGKEIDEEESVELFNAEGRSIFAISIVADELRKRSVGDNITFVINRNINFTNVCIKRCGFCAFSRDFRTEEGYLLPIDEIVKRAKEAYQLGATEVCIQAGLPPKMDGHLYIDICSAIKKELPDIHIHAFSPEEILYGSTRLGVSVLEYLKMLKEAGIGSLPGTSAEILDQQVRDDISPGRITANEWINIITTAHSIGIPTTSTIMYGHVETVDHIVKHISTLRKIQKETKGFTEFVPLSFIHHESPMFHTGKNGLRSGPTGMDIVKIHAISRIMLNGFINNIQVSWVKEGPRISQLLLNCGANDLGGTLINESISTSAGASNGQIMTPRQLYDLIKSTGRIPAQRNTLYRILKTYNTYDSLSPLDNADPQMFGSYHQLIKLDKFRYTRK